MPKTIEQMLDDLNGIVGYLQRKYQVDKIVLWGHSWGSLLGSLYVQKHPENGLSYIGVEQVVDMMENERTAYQQTCEMAKNTGNAAHMRALEKLGDYPPSDAEQLLKLLSQMRKIQQAYDDGPASGSGLSEMLKTMRRSPSFQWSDLVSFIRAIQVNRPLIMEILSINLKDYPTRYAVPMHYILGEADTIMPTTLTKAYYDTIDAPCKTFVVIPGAGHSSVYERPAEAAVAFRAVRETL